MIRKVLFSTLLITVLSGFLQAAEFEPLEKLVQRRVSWLSGKVSFEKIPADAGKDVFELWTRNGKLIIGASNNSAASFGLNWYLKYYCRRSMSHLGDNLTPVAKLPEIKTKIRRTAQAEIRYALNYCTINYSMAFYDWKDWERELDWMALNGVNLLLMPVGTEAVWQKTLKKIGFSDKEILDFIPGPAFTAWWLMGNLEGWGGHVSQTMINQQTLLVRKILQRMKELGIQPVGQSFYGIVPTTLKQKVSAKIISQGNWAGGFQRPDFLLPEDPYFLKLSDIYYEEYKKLYGKDFQYFGGDPFHEGGKTVDIDVKKSALIIQNQMQKHFPESIWVLQGWQANPSGELLSGLNKPKTLVIELFGENTRNWEKRKGYEGTPFVWGTVSNFGEKVGLFGRLERFASEINRAAESSYAKDFRGVGIVPEGINNNPVAYDLVFELAWHKEKLDVKDWLKNYVRYRYGTDNEKLQNAWQMFLQTVYSSPSVYQEGPSESIFCARPNLDLESVSSWGTRKKNYDVEKFAEAVKLFVSAENEIPSSETYKTDKIDFLRQVNANKADEIYLKMSAAIKRKDVKEFQTAYADFEKLLLAQDRLLKDSPYFSLSTWLKRAENFGKTTSDKKLAVKNAKTLITFWGPDNPQTDLRDYSHREWSGLLSTLYLARWRKFAENTVKKLNNQHFTENYFQMEKNWAEGKDMNSGN